MSTRHWSLAGAVGVLVILVGACCSLPSYTPAFWNDGGVVQGNNNCYNYANNKRTDTFAQPGEAAGAKWAALTCPAVDVAAVADGIDRAPASGECPHKKCKIALVVWPDHDYHWYRLDTNGLWTHKPGGTQATNLDNSGNVIPNPETADRGPYVNFCGYYCSCSSSTEGEGHETIQ
ncbi:MAG: hypothetical protein PVG07_00895 [Acidobacteriota bacterium]|jgi:hypothetical protein